MTRFLGMFSIVLLLAVLLIPSRVYSQGFGGMGGFGGAGDYSGRNSSDSAGTWHPNNELRRLPPEEALNFITVDGTADIRVVPEEIRVVLAVTAEAETAAECQEKSAQQVQDVIEAWEELEIAEDKVVEDFINVLPRYEWRITQRDGEDFRIQQHEGFRMQTNLHVLVETEQEAMDAINLAFKQGVTDIVTFDYWSSKVNDSQVEARAVAIEAAKKKAETLLAVFDDPPKVINIQERTAVFSPHSLYRTYENVLEEEVKYHSSWERLPAIKAYRPKKTFFQGLQSRSDLRPSGAPMNPEIAVVSTVRIYYQSPSDKTVDGKADAKPDPFGG